MVILEEKYLAITVMKYYYQWLSLGNTKYSHYSVKAEARLPPIVTAMQYMAEIFKASSETSTRLL